MVAPIIGNIRYFYNWWVAVFSNIYNRWARYFKWYKINEGCLSIATLITKTLKNGII